MSAVRTSIIVAAFLFMAASSPVQAQGINRPPKYKFINGERWGNPAVGYVCRGANDSRERYTAQEHAEEVLRIYATAGSHVEVDLQCNPDIFGLAAGPHVTRAEANVPGGQDHVDFHCRSWSSSGEVDHPFLVRITPSANLPYFVVGAVSFELYGFEDQRSDDLPKQAATRWPGHLQDDQTTTLTHVYSVSTDVTLHDDDPHGWLDRKPIQALVQSWIITEFDDQMARPQRNVACKGQVIVDGEVHSDIQGVVTGRLFAPQLHPMDDPQMRVVVPHYTEIGIPEWSWHKNGNCPFQIDDDDRFITLNTDLTARVLQGNPRVTVGARLKTNIAYILPRFPF